MDLNAIEQRASAATEGPLRIEAEEFGRVILDPTGRVVASASFINDAQEKADAEFFTAARTDVPDLVARVRELEAENEKLRDTAAVARYVADHWREAAVANGWTVASHPLCLVLAALNGKTEPEQLGLNEEDRAGLDWARDIAKEEK